jgi:hypothetical protein
LRRFFSLYFRGSLRYGLLVFVLANKTPEQIIYLAFTKYAASNYGINMPDLQPFHLRLDQNTASLVDLTFLRMADFPPDAPTILAEATEQLRRHLRTDAQLGRQQTLPVYLLTF